MRMILVLLSVIACLMPWRMALSSGVTPPLATPVDMTPIPPDH
jgi:hypothetical protein